MSAFSFTSTGVGGCIGIHEKLEPYRGTADLSKLQSALRCFLLHYYRDTFRHEQWWTDTVSGPTTEDQNQYQGQEISEQELAAAKKVARRAAFFAQQETPHPPSDDQLVLLVNAAEMRTNHCYQKLPPGILSSVNHIGDLHSRIRRYVDVYAVQDVVYEAEHVMELYDMFLQFLYLKTMNSDDFLDYYGYFQCYILPQLCMDFNVTVDPSATDDYATLC